MLYLAFAAGLAIGAVGPPAPADAGAAICEAVFHQEADVFGGNNLFLLPSGAVWVQTIYPAYGRGGYIDSRYMITATEEERQALSSLAVTAEFFKLKSAKRAAVPEESELRITLRRCDGAERTVQQFDRDASPAFRLVANYFWALKARAVSSAPVYEGEPDFRWSPPRE
jgi:hypothetical protein